MKLGIFLYSKPLLKLDSFNVVSHVEIIQVVETAGRDKEIVIIKKTPFCSRVKEQNYLVAVAEIGIENIIKKVGKYLCMCVH